MFNPNDVLDPCSDDPDHFFRFRSDGSITIRADLSPGETRRAEETLRVFNLHPKWGRLRNMRKRAVSDYLYLVDGCDGFSVAELRDLLNSELAAIEAHPFSTAIRHVLTEP
jgi:hypothetical protein